MLLTFVHVHSLQPGRTFSPILWRRIHHALEVVVAGGHHDGARRPIYLLAALDDHLHYSMSASVARCATAPAATSGRKCNGMSCFPAAFSHERALKQVVNVLPCMIFKELTSSPPPRSASA